MMGFERRGARWLLTTMLALAAACGDDDGMMDDAGRDGATMSDGGGDGGDRCTGIVQCAAVGTTCAGDELVTCALDANGCRVETRTDCSASDQVCDASGSAAACVTPDPCADVVDACETEGRSCDGDALVICAPNEDGCLVATTTDCAEMPGGACDDGATPMCVLPADPCEGVADACETAGTSCDGTSLVTCAPNAFGCLVETATDCASRAGGTCDATDVAECTFTGDPCDGIDECTPGAPTCEGPSLVTCAADAFGCFVQTRTDCTEAPFGFCDADAETPICSTAAVDPCMGVTECDPIGRACDANALEVCALNAFGCAVETRTDCTTDGDVCDATSGMAACVDPCTLVDVCETATSCEGREVVTCTPDANGCLVESDRTSCESDEICDPLMGMAECADDLCPAAPAVILDCTSGTVAGNTAMGSATITSYPGCTESTNYGANEQIHRFRSATRQRVTVVSTRGASTSDFDLFVTRPAEGGACANGMTCVTGSRGVTATETVTFVAEPSELYYVIYDRFSTGTDTDYALAITCEPIVCGDGVAATEEACDDGNTDPGDGCSSTCTVEDGFACASGSPSVCNEIVCGDGRVQGTEACDDGDLDDGDGCSMACAIEADYLCTGTAPSTCVLACGNGNVEAARGEQCDDGDRDPGDGCSATCTVEDGFRCTGTMPTTCVALAANATCATAEEVTEASSYVGVSLALGGVQPTATGCGGGTSNRTLYYEVTVPPSSRVSVTTNGGSGTSDFVLFFLDACDAAACSFATDAAPERGTITNVGASPITRIVGIRSYSSATPSPADISFAFESVSFASNATCATATPITATTTLSAQPLGQGGPRPTGSGCGTGAGDTTLYYSVSIPAGQRVQVQTTPGAGSDIVLMTQNACSDAGCASFTNTAPERTTLENTTASAITRIVAVRPLESSTVPFDIAFTYETIPTVPNGTCAGATPVTESTSFTGQDLSAGGAQPTATNCGTGTSNRTLYYAVTLPPSSRVNVTTNGGSGASDFVLFFLDSCGAAACSFNTNSSPERGELSNPTASPITRIVGVRSASSPTPAALDITFAFQSVSFAGNAACASATPVTASTTFSDLDLSVGGPQPTATSCGGGVSNRTRYYEVTVPPASRVDVTTTGTSTGAGDIVLFFLDSCGAASCSFNTDSAPERGTILNTGAAPITRIVGVRSYSSTTPSLAQIAFAFSSLPYTFAPISAACVDVSGGTAIANVTADDSASARIALPFAFDYFGAPVTHYSVSSNGMMQLWPSDMGTPSSEWSNVAIPSTSLPNGYVAPFWDDLRPNAGANAVLLVEGSAGSRRMIVQWTNWRAENTADAQQLTFQAHLVEGSDVIEYHYCSMTGAAGQLHTGSSATIGVENLTGSEGISISFNTAAAVSTGSGFRLTPP